MLLKCLKKKNLYKPTALFIPGNEESTQYSGIRTPVCVIVFLEKKSC